jgi:hypothetical protein
VADYRVWRVANPAPSAILQGPVTLAGAANYTIPPNARQSGSSDRLDTGDVRVLQAAGTGNLIEGVHSTGCALGGGENESCVRYVRFNVGCTDTDGIAAAFDQQFTFGGGDGDFFFWPGTARNIDGQSGIAFQRSSAETFLSAAWCVKPADGTCTIVSNFTTGTCAQDPLLENRTGDYVGAHTDGGVNFKDFCFGGERAVPLTLGDERLCLWQTWITCVRPGDDVVEPGLAWQQESGGEADASGPPSLLSP